jgi:hypothetical protein
MTTITGCSKYAVDSKLRARGRGHLPYPSRRAEHIGRAAGAESLPRPIAVLPRTALAPALHSAPRRVGIRRAHPSLTDRSMGLIRALTRNRAWTDPDAPEPWRRGRAYAIPFSRVWSAVRDTARERTRWTLTGEDARRGELNVEARSLLWGFVDDVWIRVSLDPHGLTRVDLKSQSRVGRMDLGVNARRIARFLHALDRRLGEAPGRNDTDAARNRA